MTWPDYRGNLDWLKDRTILLVRSGSHAYGTNIASSDEDFKGVAIPPKKYFTGFMNRFEQADSHEPDLCIYDIRKFFNLAADCNPSIIEVLWTDAVADTVQCTTLGHKLCYNRKLFLSQKARYTFAGYAFAQLKRIKTHRDWLMNPQDEPRREDYGPREKEYRAAKLRYDQYQLWKRTRNPIRAEMEARFGMDCKHASHLVRLLRMSKEILTTGQVRVKRDDAKELLEIRNGAWSYDKLIDWADKMDGDMDSWMKDSPLPHSPDRVKLDELCQELVEEML